MSKVIDLTNQVFGKLTVIERVENSKDGKAQWLCKCSCGNERIVLGRYLRNNSITACKSCSCKNINYINLVGQTFGRLTVIQQTDQRQGSSVIWQCKCKCGNICYKSSKDLRSGHCKSCGCLQRESRATPHKNLIGQRFGFLTVIALTEKSNYEGRLWECQCDCGNKKLVSTYSLTAGRVRSCGCINSLMNSKIETIFRNLNIKYEKEKIFNDCIDVLPLRFDFYLPEYNLCIEYDGEQHFKEVTYWNGKNGLKNRQQKDSIKNDYCKINKINLIRLNYLDKEKINEQYIHNLLSYYKKVEID